MNSSAERTSITGMSTLTFMFFSFGFVTTMNNILIPYMQTLFSLTNAQAMFINMVWYGAYGVAKSTITPDALAELQKINWTGNIRELRNVIERLLILCDKNITAKDVQMYAHPLGNAN